MKLLFAAAVVPAFAAAFFQMPATPPMKMGLWETTVNTKMSGMDLPPGMNVPGLGNNTTTVKVCMTPESYAKNLGGSTNARQKDCVRSNEVWTAKGYAFDLSCNAGKMTGHFQIIFDNDTESHGVTHMTMNTGGRSMQMDSISTSKFLSSDCGGIAPDKPVIGH